MGGEPVFVKGRPKITPSAGPRAAVVRIESIKKKRKAVHSVNAVFLSQLQNRMMSKAGKRVVSSPQAPSS